MGFEVTLGVEVMWALSPFSEMPTSLQEIGGRAKFYSFFDVR
jgi:hypothetical protein